MAWESYATDALLGAAGLGSLSFDPTGMINNALGSIVGGRSNERAFKKQKELIKYQADIEQAMWQTRFDATNAYNTPTAMRMRLNDAGLNPNLVYGALGPNTAQSPSVSAPSGQLSKYQNTLETLSLASTIAAQRSQVALNKKEEAVKDSEVNLNNAKADEAYAAAKRHRSDSANLDVNTAINEIYKVWREEQRDAWQNPFMQGYEIKEQERAMNVQIGLLNEQALKLNEEKWTHQKMLDMKYFLLAQADFAVRRDLTRSQIKLNTAMAFDAYQSGLLKSTTREGVVLDNKGKEIHLNYQEYDELLTLYGKYTSGRLNEERVITEIHKQLNLDTESARNMVQSMDIVLKRGQSMTRQLITGGLMY